MATMKAQKIRAGASGFSFKEWKGSFYPEKIKADAMLQFYGERLPTVEINSSFYGMPSTPKKSQERKKILSLQAAYEELG
eukprot:gene39154-52909_t